MAIHPMMFKSSSVSAMSHHPTTVFISHGSEDKAAFVRPIADALRKVCRTPPTRLGGGALAAVMS